MNAASAPIASPAVNSFADLPTDRSAAAMWLAEVFGWHVVPVGGDKKPFPGTHGCLDATNDIERVKAMFAAHPNANVGVATGAASGFFAVDVDVKNGVGWTGLEAFERQYGKLPETLTVETPSGGKHFLYAYPEEVAVGNKGNVDKLQIDVRGEGGYVLAPPSFLRSGGSYRVAHNAPIAPAPEKLLARLGKGTGAPTDAAASSITGAIAEGGRNSMLCSIAGTLRRRGANEEAIIGALHSFNEAQCEPPLEHSEVERIARSVARYTPESHHPDTDVGNARRLVDALNGKARFDHASRAWFTFDGRCWRRDADGAIVREAKSVGDRLLAEAQAINDHDSRKRRIAFALKSQASTRVRAMVELAQSEPGIPVAADAFDRPAYLLNARNGTIDLRSGELLPHDPAHLLSRMI